MIPFWSGNKGGAVAEVNGTPVEHTLSDPEVHINEGRNGILLLAFILVIKSAATVILHALDGAPLLPSVLIAAPSLITITILGLCVAIYRSLTIPALLTALIFGGLELVGYIATIAFGILTDGPKPSFMAVVWTLARLSALYLIFDALRWLRKRRLTAL